jgi:hypothetical protein
MDIKVNIAKTNVGTARMGPSATKQTDIVLMGVWMVLAGLSVT